MMDFCRRTTALILLLFCSVGAARAVQIDAADYAMRVPPAAQSGQRVAISVIDSRPYVLSGESSESYEGMSREVYGIPISRETSDRKTMALYLGERLRIGFERAGYLPALVAAPKGSRPSMVAEGLASLAGRAFVVELREWSYDMGFAKPSFTYDITVNVYSNGELLSSTEFSGADPMPKGGRKHFKKRFAELYPVIFERVFAHPEVAAGLAGRQIEVRGQRARAASIQDRLEELTRLLDAGSITADEYEAQRTRVLSEL